MPGVNKNVTLALKDHHWGDQGPDKLLLSHLVSEQAFVGSWGGVTTLILTLTPRFREVVCSLLRVTL